MQFEQASNYIQEELKSKLFNKNYQTKVEYRDSFPHFQKREVVDSWQKKENTDPNSDESFFESRLKAH